MIDTLKLIHLTEEEKREKTSKKRIKNKFLFVSSDSRGTHAIQSLIDSLNDKAELVACIAEIFEQDLMKFAFNKHATHVLIKFIKVVDVHPHLQKIYEQIVKNLGALSENPNGLPVVKNTI